MEFLHTVNGTKHGECMGKCGKMITKDDKDHALCNSCWNAEFSKMPKARVTFANDHPEVLMKPHPAEVRVFRYEDPPEDISSTSSEEDEPKLKRNPNAWVPPHKRIKAGGPTPLVRKEPVQHENCDLALQCDEGFRSTDEEEFSDYCPGCESGCDADDAHRSGHEGDGYHPDCYMDPPHATTIVPSDDELLRRKHSNRAIARILQEASKIPLHLVH